MRRLLEDALGCGQCQPLRLQVVSKEAVWDFADCPCCAQILPGSFRGPHHLYTSGYGGAEISLSNCDCKYMSDYGTENTQQAC